MTLCVVCSSTGAKPRHTAGGTCYGPACDACEVLAWDSHWHRVTGAQPWESAVLAWRTRRHLAQLDGRTFLEPMPTLPGEAALDLRLSVLGVLDLARELEGA